MAARINLRVRPPIKTMLVKAAGLRRVKLTEFMIKSAQAAAEMALADRTRFVLPEVQCRSHSCSKFLRKARSVDLYFQADLTRN